MKYIILIIPIAFASCASCNRKDASAPNACASQNQEKTSEHSYHWMERGDF